MENNNKCTLVKNSTLQELKKPVQDVKQLEYQIEVLTNKNRRLEKQLEEVREYNKLNPVIKEVVNPMKISICIYKEMRTNSLGTSTYKVNPITIGENIDLEYGLQQQINRIAKTFFRDVDKYLDKKLQDKHNKIKENTINLLCKKSLFKRWIFFRKWRKAMNEHNGFNALKIKEYTLKQL